MDLFSSFQLGSLELKNRVVMAPMTRCRASENSANDLMRQYYEQRAQAGLIITEGTAPSANGLGYARIPGLFTTEQAQSFRPVTDAVHAAGGRIFVQLMHVGRIAHPLNMPNGARMVAPSTVQAAGTMWTDQDGMQPHPEPEALSSSDIQTARKEFVASARLAVEAGFDGIELHSANGYLLNQFLHPHTNRRSDEYGGSAQARLRFVLEVAEATAQAIGKEKVGIRLSPHSTFNDLPETDGVTEQYQLLAEGLRDLVYIHLVSSQHPDESKTRAAIRKAYGGPVMINGGLERDSAEELLTSNQAELVSFARSFLANPDLVERFRTSAPLNEPDADTFYTPGPEGYVDYPTLSESERD